MLSGHVAVRRTRPMASPPSGAIATDFRGGAVRDNADLNRFIASQTPLGRVGEADDIGAAVDLLLSPGAHWINGQRIEASGGMRVWQRQRGWRARPYELHVCLLKGTVRERALRARLHRAGQLHDLAALRTTSRRN